MNIKRTKDKELFRIQKEWIVDSESLIYADDLCEAEDIALQCKLKLFLLFISITSYR
jgi:hypothetical protein